MQARPLWLIILLWSCGGAQASTESNPPVKAAPAEAAPETEEAAAAEPPEAPGVPTDCAKKNPCLPDPRFVQRLCAGSYPSVALFLFSQSPPFTRAYLTRRAEAWNASGGVSETGHVEFDEEVLLLRVRKPDYGGMQVSGAGGGYDALRWSGSCVTLSDEEVTLKKPPAPKSGKVEFRFLDTNIQEALREDQAVDEAYRVRRTECKGATTGDVSLKCVRADAKLSEAIIRYVRSGAKLPEPERIP